MKLKEVFAWSMYDLANTAFSALFVSFFFPFYIKEFLGGNELQIGLVFGLSMLFVAVIVPIIGAWSDKIKRRMPFIIVFTLICCMFTYFVIKVSLLWALIFGFIANLFYHAALAVYNALLPEVASKKEYGWVSGIGIGFGYVGTLLSLMIAFFILDKLGWETIEGIRAMFPLTAIFFVAFSIFTFFGIKEKGNHKKNKLSEDIKHAFAEVGSTIKSLRKYKSLLYFLGSMFMYVNAINAVIVFLYLYGRSEIGLSVKSFMYVYILFSLAAVLGSLIFGKITDKKGAKTALVWAGLLWILTIIILLNVANLTTFIIGGLVGGIALGTVWTASRPLTIRLSPKRKLGQFFGFLELTDKFSGVIGPIVFGYLVVASGYTAALVSLLVFFIAGLALLWKVPGP